VRVSVASPARHACASFELATSRLAACVDAARRRVTGHRSSAVHLHTALARTHTGARRISGDWLAATAAWLVVSVPDGG
jgi:hypothetical protein